MSLIAWFPLNGNLNNQGSGTFNISTSPSYTTGKVTNQCATHSGVNGGNTYLTSETLSLSATNPISIFAWVKMNSYSTTGANLNGLVSNHSHDDQNGSGFGLNLRNEGSQFRVSISTPVSSAGVRTYSAFYSEGTFTTGSWHHVGIVYTGSVIKLFLDGVQQTVYINGSSTGLKEISLISSVASNNKIGIFSWSTTYNTYSSECNLNDVRIYDHALSQKEVHELAQGLCLHYSMNFEDLYTPVEYLQSSRVQYIDTGVYLSQGMNFEMKAAWLGYSSYDTLIGSRGGADYFMRLYGGLTSRRLTWGGTSTTCGSATAGTNYIIKTTGSSSKTITFTSGTTTETYTGSSGSTTATTTAWLFGIDNAGSLYRPSASKIYYCKIYDESGTLIRDYIPCVRNYDAKPGLFDLVENKFYVNQGSGADFTIPTTIEVNTTIPDNSGYGNNGTAVSVLPTNETGLGNQAVSFSGTNYIQAKQVLSYITDGTICWWQRDTSTYNRVLFQGKAPTSGSSNYMGAVYSSDGYYIYSQNAGTNYYYKNAVKDTTSRASGVRSATQYSDDGTWNFYCIKNINLSAWTYFCVSGYATNWYFGGQIADVKIFATALSDDDITQLYQSKASIDNTGKLHCNCYEEVESEIKLPMSTGVVKAGNASEASGNLKLFGGYTELDYIQRPSTSTPFIDTGFTPNSNTRVVMKCMMSSVANDGAFLYGAGGSSGADRAFEAYPWTVDSAQRMIINYVQGTDMNYIGAVSANTIIELDHNKNNISMNVGGTSYTTTFTTNTFTSPNSLYLFALHRNSIYNPSGGNVNIYYCKIYDNGTLIRDFVPVKRNSDSVVGLFDKVNNVFYTNSGSGSFTGGNEIGTFNSIKTTEIIEGGC